MATFSEEFQEIILPVVICFAIYNVLGFFGNILVLYIYGLRYPRNRFRSLVLALSMIDFTSCCSTVPMETVSTWLWFEAPSRNLCKAKNFFVQFTGLSAMYMLFVTAVCKYRKICKPFNRQINHKLLVILCSCGIIGSFVCATPAALLWDINNHTITWKNTTETVRICEVRSDYHRQNYPAMYRHLLSAYDVFLFVTIILYIFVARAAVLHVRRINKLQKTPGGLFISHSCSVTISSKYMFKAESVCQSDDNQTGSATLTELSTDTTHSQSTISEETTSTRQRAKYSHRQAAPVQIRKVLIMVIIAGTFSVTFLMALTFGYVFAIRNYGDYSSVSELVVLFCCYRFYFINYAMNPIVYFALDPCFRREVLVLLSCGKWS